MSVKVMSNVWDLCQQQGSAKLLLLLLADYANEEGSNAYPSYSTIAKKLNITERQAKRLVADMVAQGELSVTPRCRDNGSTTSNSYELAAKYVRGVTPMSPQGDAHVTPGGDVDVTPRSVRKEPIQNNAHVREESAWQQLHAAVAKAMRRSPFMMTEEENGAVDRLYASGYTAEQIERYYGAGGYWRTRDWRGTKNQPLTVGALEETIGTCQDFEEHPEDYAAATTKPKVSNGEVDSAFEKLTRLASGYGARRFKDALPELRENGLVPVVEKLGWQEICLTPREQLIWQFRSAYRDAVPA